MDQTTYCVAYAITSSFSVDAHVLAIGKVRDKDVDQFLAVLLYNAELIHSQPTPYGLYHNCRAVIGQL